MLLIKTWRMGQCSHCALKLFTYCVQKLVSFLLTGDDRTAAQNFQCFKWAAFVLSVADRHKTTVDVSLKSPCTFPLEVSSNASCSSNYSVAFTDRLGEKGILPFYHLLIFTGPCHICDSPWCCTLFFSSSPRPLPRKAVSPNQAVLRTIRDETDFHLQLPGSPVALCFSNH